MKLQPQELRDHLAKLRAESDEVKQERIDLTKRLDKIGTVADLDKLSIEESKIKIHEDEIALRTRQTQTLLSQMEAAERAEAALERGRKVQADLDHVAKTRYLCGQCDSVMKYDGPRRPSGLSITGQDWKMAEPPYPYVVALDCANCNSRILRSPEELLEDEETSKRPARPKKNVLQGSPSGSFHVMGAT
ncbi:MAG: hypothetical protein ABSF63_03930 [Candidatus Bathyarchaeia archaeon]|jgi:hypothetical protein